MNLEKIEKLVKIIENSSMLDFSIQEGFCSPFLISARGKQVDPYDILQFKGSQISCRLREQYFPEGSVKNCDHDDLLFLG